MPQSNQAAEADPIHHTTHIREMLTGIIQHARQDVEKVRDPQARALFETTAEVLLGLRKAYEDYEKHSESAWRIAS